MAHRGCQTRTCRHGLLMGKFFLLLNNEKFIHMLFFGFAFVPYLMYHFVSVMNSVSACNVMWLGFKSIPIRLKYYGITNRGLPVVQVETRNIGETRRRWIPEQVYGSIFLNSRGGCDLNASFISTRLDNTHYFMNDLSSE